VLKVKTLNIQKTNLLEKGLATLAIKYQYLFSKKNISIIPVEDKKPNKSFIDTRNELDFIIPSYEVMIRKMIDMMLKKRNT